MTTDVLYIAGAGRSGSTFLSMLLSQHEKAFNIGQIRDLPEAFMKGAPCSCGHSVPDCPYWGSVVSRLTEKNGDEFLEAISVGMEAYGKDAAADTNWDSAAVRSRLAQSNKEFLDLYGELYRAAAERAGGAMLVDSSKSVDLALALSLIPDINLRVLNLVRDPRAVAVSWSKVLKRPMVLRRRTRNWAGRQKRLALLRDLAPQQFMLMRYEDLTLSPKQRVADIQTWAGLDEDVSFFVGPHDAKTSWDDAHLFPPANATVLKERREQIHISPAEGWKHPSNSQLHDMAEEVTFPFAETLGYERRDVHFYE